MFLMDSNGDLCLSSQWNHNLIATVNSLVVYIINFPQFMIGI